MTSVLKSSRPISRKDKEMPATDMYGVENPVAVYNRYMAIDAPVGNGIQVRPSVDSGLWPATPSKLRCLAARAPGTSRMRARGCSTAALRLRWRSHSALLVLKSRITMSPPLVRDTNSRPTSFTARVHLDRRIRQRPSVRHMRRLYHAAEALAGPSASRSSYGLHSSLALHPCPILHSSAAARRRRGTRASPSACATLPPTRILPLHAACGGCDPVLHPPLGTDTRVHWYSTHTRRRAHSSSPAHPPRAPAGTRPSSPSGTSTAAARARPRGTTRRCS